MPLVDKEKDKKRAGPSSVPGYKEEMDDILRRLNPEMKRARPGPDAMAAAMEAVQRLAAEVDTQDAADDAVDELAADAAPGVCSVCGYRNREQTKFCGMCGVALIAGESAANAPTESRGLARQPNQFPAEFNPVPPRPSGNETHHYHHHYHHHYFQGGHEGGFPRLGSEPARDERSRTPNAAMRGEMSRAEAAVRRVTQEWVLACNTKHLDDVLELYISDAVVLRSNYPAMRGAAAVREFFYGALDTGLGEVEMEPLRVEIVGELAYEAGRFKALVPSAVGKRREERGKYLWVCQRQSGGEWKVAADCWSSDLTLSNLESDIPASAAVKTAQSRKNS
ncbi:MAG TPA: nuclear transport factor 2 family protein [Candidatus Sulfotelmatobacter sp.]|nr:nuclear transport factor 2 family protein [Candidatus Sulfotelmatobacter sp.]